MILAAIAVVAFSLSWGGVALIRRWAAHYRLLDVPNPRSSHTRPTPRGGGLAIVVAVCGVFGVWLLATESWPPELLGLLLAQLLVAGVGLADDAITLSSAFRLVVHVVAAAVLLSVAGGLTFGVPLLGTTLSPVAIPLILLWLVGLTNAYNFMDGIDGIAGGQAVMAGAGWVLIGWMVDEPQVRLLGVLLTAASAGFLLQNWPPARVFMGDVGSGFLGFTFGAMTIIGATYDAIVALSGALLVWPFLFDTGLTLVRRLWRGENPLRAHRSHLYQRLVIAGCGHRDVTVLYILLAGTGLLAAVALLARWPGAGIGVAVGIPSLAAGLVRYVRSSERLSQPGSSGAPAR